MKISVVISAFNEEEKIEDCLKSVKDIAAEIIFLNNSSNDKTSAIAKKYTDKIFTQINDPLKIDLQKNYGFEKASCDWILSLDADERVTELLSKEIQQLSENKEINGYYIPRKNIIFGKWIEHTGWYPDPQLRLFRKGKGKFTEEQVHKVLTVEGRIETLTNDLLHLNYDNVDQFLSRMIRIYTKSEAINLAKNGYKYNAIGIVRMPLSEFLKRYFAEKGYKDGMHGLVLSVLMSFYHFVVFLRLWEMNKYPDEKDISGLFKEGKKTISEEVKYWVNKKNIDDETNVIKKHTMRLKRKIFS